MILVTSRVVISSTGGATQVTGTGEGETVDDIGVVDGMTGANAAKGGGETNPLPHISRGAAISGLRVTPTCNLFG